MNIGRPTKNTGFCDDNINHTDYSMFSPDIASVFMRRNEKKKEMRELCYHIKECDDFNEKRRLKLLLSLKIRTMLK